MTKADILNLKKRLKNASTLDSGLLVEAAALLRHTFPSISALTEPIQEPVEGVLHMIDLALPGWSIQLTGKAMEPNGHWRCSVRETRGSDEIEMVGIGAGAQVATALLEALLDVALQKQSA